MKTITLDELSSVVGGANGVEWQPACTDTRGKFKRVMNALNSDWFKGPACLSDAIHPDQMVVRAPATMYDGTEKDGVKGVVLNGPGFTTASGMLKRFKPGQ